MALQNVLMCPAEQ